MQSFRYLRGFNCKKEHNFYCCEWRREHTRTVWAACHYGEEESCWRLPRTICHHGESYRYQLHLKFLLLQRQIINKKKWKGSAFSHPQTCSHPLPFPTDRGRRESSWLRGEWAEDFSSRITIWDQEGLDWSYEQWITGTPISWILPLTFLYLFYHISTGPPLCSFISSLYF